MDAKQIIPVIAKVAPPLLIGVAIVLAIKKLFPAEDTETKPETAVFHPIPAKLAIITIPTAPKSFIPPLFVASVPKIPVTQTPPLPIKKKFVTREDLANAFQHGARALTRRAAVATLKNLGFGKTAAYEALLENGRFSTWLRFAPDGIITWKN